MPIYSFKKIDQQIRLLLKKKGYLQKKQEKELLRGYVTVNRLHDLINKWERRKANLDAKIMHSWSYGGPSPDNGKSDAIDEGKIQILSECLRDLREKIKGRIL